MALAAVFALSWAGVEMLGSRLRGHYSPYQIVWSRYISHLAALLLVVGPRGTSVLWRTRRPVFQIMRSLCMLAMPVCFVMGLRSGLEVGGLLFVFWLAPLMILLLERLWLRERTSRFLWAATAVAVVGTLISYSGNDAAHDFGLAFAVGTAASFACYVAMTRSLRTEAVAANLFYTAFGVAAVLTPLMPHVWVTPPLHDAVILALIGLVGLAGLWALDLAAKHSLGGSVAFLCLQVPAIVILGGLLDGDPIGLRVMSGCALIVCATLCLWQAHRGRPLNEPA